MPTYFRWFLLLSLFAVLVGLIIRNTQQTAQAIPLTVAQHAKTTDAPLQNIKQVAAGGDHTCALTITGGVKCWGANYRGQLGEGTIDSKNSPADVVSLSNGVVALAAGDDHTCALTNKGSVKCWGANYWGQLGEGTTDSKNTPADVIGLNNGVVALTAGGDHTCALTNTGEMKCWGSNFDGELGDGTRSNKTTPTNVNGLSNGVIALAAGRRHTCAVTTMGGVLCWGGNDFGQLGDGTISSKNTPTNVTDLDNGVVAVATGKYHTCAMTSTNGVKCWGQNISGQLGDGSTINKSIPTGVSGLSSNIVTLVAGGWHTCTVTNTGSVKCWGANNTGQLGDNTAANKNTPTNIDGLSGVVSLAAGGGHTCITTGTKRVKCWGYNGFGQLGNGTTSDKSKPTNVSTAIVNSRKEWRIQTQRRAFREKKNEEEENVRNNHRSNEKQVRRATRSAQAKQRDEI